MTASATASQRPICPACARPLRACLCACVREARTEIELLVLQHPLEAQQAKGTAALLQRCVPRCTVLVGERFAPPEGLKDRYTLLLYPPTEQAPAAAPIKAERLADLTRLRLVLIDATWRKSLKLLLHNRWLQQLPRLSLQDLAPSRYAIRRAHAPHQLSTLEAAAAALAQLGGCRALGWARVETPWGRRLDAKRSRIGHPARLCNTACAPKAPQPFGPMRFASPFVVGAAWWGPIPRRHRRLDWPGNSLWREPIPKPDSLLGEAPATVATLFEAMDAFIRLQQGFGPARPAPSQAAERTDQA